ncbi:MAG: 5-oxoprolinase subunit PxpA [Candidatus Methanomethylicia archaeon]
MNLKVDLNCDLGESFGRYKLGFDEEIMPHITSANIACGFHAGDPNIMRKTVKLAIKNNVEIGSHPGLPDLLGFGRRWIEVEKEDIVNYMLYQMGALDAFIKAEGGKMLHVKPHGALYNKAAVNEEVSEAIIEAIEKYNPELILVGLAKSKMIEVSEKHKIKYAIEAFADRAYMSDGSLAPRSMKGSVITNINEIIERAINMLKYGKVKTIDGKEIEIGKVTTICIHGDTPGAVEIASNLKKKLIESGIEVTKMVNIV